jgi:hypothetical protein
MPGEDVDRLADIERRLSRLEAPEAHCGATPGLMELFTTLFDQLIKDGHVDDDSDDAQKIRDLMKGYEKHGSGSVPNI